MKNIVMTAFKIIVAGGLITWLIKTKKISMEPFAQLWAHPSMLILVFAAVLALILINNYRWVLLLRGQDVLSNNRETLPLSLIGLFFNIAMPGSVGGDVVKGYYIVRRHPQAKVAVATSVLIDRLVGLYAMTLIALYPLVIHANFVFSSPKLKAMALFVLGLIVFFTIFFLVGFSQAIRTHDKTEALFKKIPAGKLFEKVYDAVHAYSRHKTEFIWGILLSVVAQTVIIVAFYFVGHALGYTSVTLNGLLFAIPLGLIAAAVPVSPGGIGVGQAVFFALFSWYPGLVGEFGVAVITIFQVVQALWSLLGAAFYLRMKNSGMS